MAKTYFQAKLTLQSATPTNGDNTEWECSFTFTDYDGAFTGLDIAPGDIIAFDTSVVETGSFTLYDVASIVTPDNIDVVLSIHYSSVNDNSSGPPDLTWLIGQDGVIARPSPHYGLLPVVSRDLQIISDKFTEYVQNYNFVKIVDNALADTSTTVFIKINRDSINLMKGMPVYISEVDYNNAARATGGGTYEEARVAGLVVDESIFIDAPGRVLCAGILEQTTTQWDALTGDEGGLLGGRDYFLRTDFVRGITHTPPETGYMVKIGKALSPTALDINIEPPIEL